MASYYLRPDRLLTFVIDDNDALQSAVVTGSVDSEHQQAWLCNGSDEYALRGPVGGGLALAIAGYSCLAGMAVLHSHNLDAAVPLSLTGDITASLADRGGNRPNRIPWNRFATFTPVEYAADVTATVVANPRDFMATELLIGERFTLPDPPEPAIRHGLPAFALPKDAEFAAGNGYDKGIAGGRLLNFRQAFTKAELESVTDGLTACWEACRNGTLPMAFVPNSTQDDVVVGPMMSLGWEDYAEWVIVEFSIQEWLRQRWPLPLVAS